MPKRKRRRDADGLYQRPESPYWWASFITADGKRARRSTGTTERREAEAILAKWKLQAHRAEHWGEAPERTFDDLMLQYLQAPSREKRSHRRDVDAARHLYAHFTGRSLSSLGSADIRAYIDQRRPVVAPATIRRELAVLSAAIEHARREWEWDIPNPIRSVRLPSLPEGRVRWITKGEAVALLRAIAQEPQSAHLMDLVRLALHTGMRRGELLGLEWRRVDLQAGVIRLEAEHTKAGRRRTVPMNTEARAAILSRMRFRAEHCPASPWVFAHKDGNRIGDVKNGFAGACRRAGIKDFRFHDLRHTCAAWLVSAGVPLPEVRDLLGHSTVKMTERYAHLAPENVRAAVAKLEGLGSLESQSSHSADLVTVTINGRPL